MIAILITKGTKYDWNHKSKEGHIWLQSVSIETKYDCTLGNRVRVTWLWILAETHQNKILMIAVIFGPYWRGLQSYMARFEFAIAIIFRPFCGKYCSHILSSSYFDCNHIRFLSNYCNYILYNPKQNAETFLRLEFSANNELIITISLVWITTVTIWRYFRIF